MRNLSLSIACSAFLCSSVALANPAGKSDLMGIKPFVGYMIGTLTETAYRGAYSYSADTAVTRFHFSETKFQNGLWGGLEFNFMEKLGLRAYANIIATAMPTNSTSSSAESGVLWIFSGNLDLVYRPTQNIGVFIGFGLGDTMIGYVSGSAATSNIDNYFTMMSNFGVQYNVNTNNILELSAILNSRFTFPQLVMTTAGTTKTLISPNIDISHSIMAKYAYRF